MPAAITLWNEVAAFDTIKAFLARVCPEVKEEDIYRSHPVAVPGSTPGPTITLVPINGGPPIRQSYMGERSFSNQRQKTQVQIIKAAVGDWVVSILGQDATYTAGGGDTLVSIRDGLRTQVDLLGLGITTSVMIIKQVPSLIIQGDVAGQSLFVTITPPNGGLGKVIVVDDVLRCAHYNWGLWTLRMVFRDQPPNLQGNQNRITSSMLADRVMSILETSIDFPITPGLASPTEGELFQANPQRISWRENRGPFSVPEQRDGVWTRGVAIDTIWDVSVGILYDVPNMVASVGEIQTLDPV